MLTCPGAEMFCPLACGGFNFTFKFLYLLFFNLILMFVNALCRIIFKLDIFYYKF